MLLIHQTRFQHNSHDAPLVLSREELADGILVVPETKLTLADILSNIEEIQLRTPDFSVLNKVVVLTY